MESNTVGFLQFILQDIVVTHRQYKCGKYRIDMYIPSIRLAIECDEFLHKDYDAEQEEKRESYIKQQLSCDFLRFDPCHQNFKFEIFIKTVIKEVFTRHTNIAQRSVLYSIPKNGLNTKVLLGHPTMLNQQPMNLLNVANELSNAADKQLLWFLLTKFNKDEEKLFVHSFYMYLKYDKEKDFVISLDCVWKWLGLNTRDDAKNVLKKYFTLNTDYRTFLTNIEQHDGDSREQILMNVRTFKLFCQKVCTNKADTVYDYYIKMEYALQEYILQIMQNQSRKEMEKLLIEIFMEKEVVYFGTFDYVDAESGVKTVLGKFGCSADIDETFREHKRFIGEDFQLQFVIECDEHIELEEMFKDHPIVKTHRVTKEINGRNLTELTDDTFTIENVKTIVNDLKKTLLSGKELFEMRHRETIKKYDVEQSKFESEKTKYELEILQKQIELTTLKQQHELTMRRLDMEQQQQAPNNNVPPQQPLPQPQLRQQQLQPHQKVVLQFDLNNNLLNTFQGVKDAARKTHLDRNSISQACRGLRPNYRGFIWKYQPQM